MSSDFGGRETFYQSVRESEQIHLVGLRSDASTSTWLRAVCTFPSLCSLMLAVCGHLTREQFTLVARPVPGEVNTHRHTHTNTQRQRGIQSRGTVTHTHTDRNLLWWSSYGLQNKHTHTLLWPNLGRRSFRPTHAAGQHNGSVCTHSNIQLTGANWRTENTPRGGEEEEITLWSSHCYQSAHSCCCCFNPRPGPPTPEHSMLQSEYKSIYLDVYVSAGFTKAVRARILHGDKSNSTMGICCRPYHYNPLCNKQLLTTEAF